MRKLLVKAQGTEFTHTGLYIGEGKVVDPGFWKGKKHVAKIPLKDYTDRYSFRVLRVDATPKEKADAVSYAEDQVGKPFSVLKMLRAGLPSDADKPRTRLNLESVFCSELIANAYHTKNFGAKRKIQHVRPVDIQRSPLTSIVGELR
jgi:uncharacterized protein YycO